MSRKTVGNKDTKKWEALFEIESENFKCQGTWLNEDKDSSTFGAVNVIAGGLISCKAFVVNGSKGAFFSFPQTKSGGKYYSQVVPMSKDVAKELQELAIECGKEFDKLDK